MNTRIAPFLLTALLAAAAPPPTRDTAPPALAAPWSLSLEARGLAVDEAAVRSAVARELARAGVAAGSDPVRIAVSVAEGGRLQVSYRSPAGAELSRSVAAPARADEVPEASALLVGNLARDEAGTLLAQLGQQAPAAGPSTPLPPVPAPAAAETAREQPPVLPLESANLSLFYPLTLRGDTEQRHLAFELGLFYSRTAAVSGLSLTALGVSRVDGPAHGVQIGGIGYWHGGPGYGVRLGTLFGASAGRFDGLSATGFATVHRGELAGVELAGFTSIATGPLEGVQASGFFDYAGSVTGVQAAGFASFSHGPVEGVQAAGFASFSHGPVEGVQAAAGVSIADGVQGLQLSVVNIGGSVDGAQIGIVNVADDVTGAQIGVVNVADSVKGQSIGFIPYNREGGLKIATWYDSSQPFNMGVRFHAGVLYMMPTFAFDPGSAALVNEPSRMRYAIGTSLGLRLPIDRAFIDLDVNESQRSNGWKVVLNENTLDLRYRVLAGYRIMKGFAVFAGGGVRHHFPDAGPRAGSLQPELSAGMELL